MTENKAQTSGEFVAEALDGFVRIVAHKMAIREAQGLVISKDVIIELLSELQAESQMVIERIEHEESKGTD